MGVLVGSWTTAITQVERERRPVVTLTGLSFLVVGSAVIALLLQQQL